MSSGGDDGRVCRRLVSVDSETTLTTSNDEFTMDSETSRGESPSPNFYQSASITVAICAMNKKVNIMSVVFVCLYVFHFI